MAPGIASTAYAMTSQVLEHITNDNSDSGSGGSSWDGDWHHHHHNDGGDSGDSNHDFSFSGGHNDSSNSNSSSDGFESSNFSGQQAELNHFLSATSQEDRTGIIITASFSIAAAMLIIYCIMYDAYRVKPGSSIGRPRKSNGAFKSMHTAEVFPFITSIAVILQGFIFVGVQAGGLSDFEVSGCRLTSELIWPAFWLIPFIVLIFSLETTIRAIRSPYFEAKGRFTTPICLFVVVLLLVGLWVTAFLLPSLDICPGSLSWWTVNYAKIAVILASTIIFTHFICGAIISVQLMRTIHIDADERMAASRIVYTLLVNTAVLSLVLPYWIQVVQGQFALETSKVADIGITLSGMLLGALHLIMRTNAEKFAIRPKNTPWAKNKKMRLFGPNDLHNKTYISAPLLAPTQANRELWFSEKSETYVDSPYSSNRTSWPGAMYSATAVEHSHTSDTEYMAEADPMDEPEYMPGFMLDDRPLPPEPVQIANPYRTRYSVFPSNREFARPRSSSYPPQATVKDSWISAGSDASSEYVELPQPLFAYRHDRKDSTMTSATVEIGIRLSSAPDFVASEDKELPLPPVAKDLPPTPTIEVETPTSTTLTSPSAASPLEQSQLNQPSHEAYLSPTIFGAVYIPVPEPKVSPPAPAPLTTGATVGIGALGLGPKGGLRPLANQPMRSSPLSNITKPLATPPESPEQEFRKGSVDSDASSKTSSSGVTASTKRPQSPAITGLPSSPRPGRSPSSPKPQARSPLGSAPRASTLRSSIESAPTTVSPESPTEWPQWPPRA